MGVDEGNDDNRAFRANFTDDGAAKLRNKVSEKLKEFMGDYTDDTLVEYVIVLLKNGRSKAEAKNELNVFLGDDSDSFVSWLWDHLGSSLYLYVQTRDSRQDEVPQINPPSEDKVVKNVSRQLDSDSDKAKSGKLHRSRHNREWRSLGRDEEAPPPFKSIVSDKVQLEEKTHQKINPPKRSNSPRKIVQKKRDRHEEEPQLKRPIASQGTMGAARRLLQFAVRDAVATSKPTSEPSLKRLRSVVSTPAADSSLDNRPHRLRSLAFAPNATSAATKAVEEAAKDVSRSSYSGNVFDRLSLGGDVSRASNQITQFDESLDYFKEVSPRGQFSEYNGDVSMHDTRTCLTSDSVSDNEGFDEANIMGRRVMGDRGDFRASTSGGYKGDDSLMVEYSVAKNGEQNMHKFRKEQEQTAKDVGASRKIVNISVNVNTWKPPHYQEEGEIRQVDNRKNVQDIEPSLGGFASVANGNTKPAADIQKETRKIPPATHRLYATGRPTEDADSRTIFVSNVHFAATKDSLSRHFNKFGEVLKVIILTDAATGQLKGSAYVEFMRKEAAESALSLDGTSFMSRILKVVRKSSAHQDTTQVVPWPRAAIRGSPFAPTVRFGRGSFLRGIHGGGSFKARPPIKPGARSLQWKREDASSIPSEEVNNNSINNNNSAIPSLSLGTRSLTYVRPDQNTNGLSVPSS